MDLSIFSLENRVAIVTGAASTKGVGRAAAIALAKAGADVVVCDVNLTGDDYDLEATAAEVRKQGRRSLALKVDITSEADVKTLVERTALTFGTIDILVNNAAIDTYLPWTDDNKDLWDKMMAVNVRGCHNCCKAVSKIMMEKKKGAIVNVNTITASKWAPHLYLYSISKAANRFITQYLARELAPFNIRVNGIAPGNIDTAMGDHSIGENSLHVDHSMKSYGIDPAKTLPIGRICKPEDVANTILLLVTDAAGYIIGNMIQIDGGTSL
jgi:NAD(P)-dependent dehydrogenase (short-subunit alcohol dehydrogenase family)